MANHEAVEAALARLVPVALSQGAQSEIEAIIDELAADAPRVERHAGRIVSGWAWMAGRPAWWRRTGMGIGVAAALTGGIWLAGNGTPEKHRSVEVASVDFSDGVVLVGESDRVSSMMDIGWSEDYDGAAMQTMHLSVVGENSFLDEETGIVMQVSEPREEFILMPVSTF